MTDKRLHLCCQILPFQDLYYLLIKSYTLLADLALSELIYAVLMFIESLIYRTFYTQSTYRIAFQNSVAGLNQLRPAPHEAGH